MRKDDLLNRLLAAYVVAAILVTFALTMIPAGAQIRFLAFALPAAIALLVITLRVRASWQGTASRPSLDRPPVDQRRRSRTSAVALAVIVTLIVAGALLGGLRGIPLLLAMAAAPATVGMLTGIRRRRTLARLDAAGYLLCPECGFDLSHVPERARCPECGDDYSVDAVRRQWRIYYPPARRRTGVTDTITP